SQLPTNRNMAMAGCEDKKAQALPRLFGGVPAPCHPESGQTVPPQLARYFSCWLTAHKGNLPVDNGIFIADTLADTAPVTRRQVIDFFHWRPAQVVVVVNDDICR